MVGVKAQKIPTTATENTYSHNPEELVKDSSRAFLLLSYCNEIVDGLAPIGALQ
jgi:hypothetical protein